MYKLKFLHGDYDCMTKKIFLLLTATLLSAVAYAQPENPIDGRFEKVVERLNQKAALEHSQKADANTEAENQKNMAVCPECGREVPVGTRCSNHHKPILVTANENTEEASEDSSTWVCPECGRHHSTDVDVCSHGHKPVPFRPEFIHEEHEGCPIKIRPNNTCPTHYAAKTPVTSHGPICPECGRTPEEVKIHGHNHK